MVVARSLLASFVSPAQWVEDPFGLIRVRISIHLYNLRVFIGEVWFFTRYQKGQDFKRRLSARDEMLAKRRKNSRARDNCAFEIKHGQRSWDPCSFPFSFRSVKTAHDIALLISK